MIRFIPEKYCARALSWQNVSLSKTEIFYCMNVLNEISYYTRGIPGFMPVNIKTLNVVAPIPKV